MVSSVRARGTDPTELRPGPSHGGSARTADRTRRGVVRRNYGASVGANAGVLHELPIAGELLARGLRELLGPRAADREPLVAEFVAHFGIGKRLRDLGVKPGDDLLPRSGR